MNFSQFEALYWIGRLGSFHGAARHLKLSQPAISGRIRDLERELGVALFDRSQRKVRPTAKGHQLLQYAAQLMTISAEIERRVGSRETVAGRVRLGVTAISALTWASEVVARMNAEHPEVDVELTVDTSEMLYEQIEAGQLDVTVLAGPIDSAKVISERLGKVAMSWLASPKLNLPTRPASALEIAALPIISDRPGSYLYAAAMDWFRREGVEPQIHHACSSLPTRIQLATQGLGVAFAAASAASRELAQGTLRIVPTIKPTPAIEYFIASAAFGVSPATRVVAETAKLLISQTHDLETYYSAVERLIQWNVDKFFKSEPIS